MSTKQSAKTYDRKLGAMLRRERIQRGMSQPEVGKILGVTFQQVQKYEVGVTRVSMSAFSVLAGIYGAHIYDLARDIDGNVMMPEGYHLVASICKCLAKMGAGQKHAVLVMVKTIVGGREAA